MLCSGVASSVSVRFRPGHHRRGQVRRQPLRGADRASARPAAAVGRAEGLVQVQVTNVEAQVAQLHPAQQGVHVGPVAVDQPARLVDDAADLDDVGVEQAQGAGQRYHHPGQAVVGHVVQRLQVHVALAVRRQLHHLEPGHGRRRRVGAVSAVGDGHLRPPGLPQGGQVTP